MPDDVTPDSPRLPRDLAAEDLDELEWALMHRASYFRRGDVPSRDALDSIRAALDDELRLADFRLQVGKFIALLHDGHARAAGVNEILPEGFLPFLPVQTRGGIAAILPDRSSAVDPEHPLITSIDGVELAKWIEMAAQLAPHSSANWKQRNAIRNLRYIEWLRSELDLPRGGPIRVTLSSIDGMRHIERLVQPVDHRPLYETWPRTVSRMLRGNIGCIRIPAMDRDFVAHVHSKMREYRDTACLIIDVRGNTGGSRDVLRSLLPYFMSENEPATVVNVARYRSNEALPESHLANRFLFRQDDPRWSDDARNAIANFVKDFRPEWTPPDDEFSDWHYFVIERSVVPRVFHYDKPVIILMDENCFSATDIFLGACKGRLNITLLGARSGGGSGRVMPLQLKHSGITVVLSTMASFRPNGMMYDGRGIDPDVIIEPVWTDCTGETDTMLERAMTLLRGDQ